MTNRNKKYCVGSNMKPVEYNGQKQPIIVGDLQSVKKWIDNFFKSLYK